MSSKIRAYPGPGIEVSYDVRRCIHAEECVHGLPQVFIPQGKPWIQPQHASADEIAEVVARCPTGALQFQRQDGGPAEATPAPNRIRIAPDGPLYVRGDIEIVTPDGTQLLKDRRVALCRCGASQHKPFCDNSHIESGFRDPGRMGDDFPQMDESLAGVTRLAITPGTNKSLACAGEFELLSADGQTALRGNRTWLCRCGGSAKKPFCDGTHKTNGFQG
jgi:CDGSH-type Zn-finger protein/uncharacterized Fe-S cluster protein YjdI